MACIDKQDPLLTVHIAFNSHNNGWHTSIGMNQKFGLFGVAGVPQCAAIISSTTSEGLQSAAAAHAADEEGGLSGESLCAALRLIRAKCRNSSETLSKGLARLKVAPLAGTAQQGDVRVEQLVAEVYARELRVLNRGIFLLTGMIRDCEKRGVDATILAGFTP